MTDPTTGSTGNPSVVPPETPALDQPELPLPGSHRPFGPSAASAWLLSRGSLLIIWALVVLVFGLIEPAKFLQAGTFQTIFDTPVELIFLCLALVITFSVGEFDLSVAAMMGISGTLVSVLTVNHGMNPWLATVLAVVAAGAVGLLNGALVVGLGVNPIVVTLGVGTAVVGVALWITNLNTINGLPSSFSKFAITSFLGLAVSFWYGLILTVFLAYVLLGTPLGLRMAFVGANREVARLAGIRVNRIRLGSYVASGVISGLGGVILAATLGGYDPGSSPNYLLPAFAAVFLGTAVIQPGKFNPIGAFIGIYFLQTGIVGLQLAGLTGWIEDVFYGGTLVLAVTISTIVQRRSEH